MANLFRLAGLLRLRKMQEEQAAEELARANVVRRAADRRKQQAADRLSGSTLPSHGDSLAWHVAIAGRAALAGMVAESVVAVDLADERVRQAAEHWSDARARSSALGKLEDRHTVTVQADEARAEQLVIDEAAARQRRTDLTPPDGAPGGDQ